MQLWLSFPNLIREVAAPHLRLPFKGAPGRPFSGGKGGNPQLLWSLVAMLEITEIGNTFFKEKDVTLCNYMINRVTDQL